MQQTSYKTHFPLQILIKLSFFWLTESLYIFFYSIYFMYYVFGPPTMCQSCQQSSKQSFQTFSIFSTRKWQKINFTSFTNYYRSLCQTLLISKEMSIQLFHFETNPWQEFLWPRIFSSPTLYTPGHNILCPVKWLIIGLLQPGA